MGLSRDILHLYRDSTAATGLWLTRRDCETAMKSGRRLPSVAWFAAAACAAMTIWLAADSDDSRHAFIFSGWKGDYYSRLVSGFSHGHLYMEADAEPGLASSDPKIRERTPTLLDASYYKGHFYLYYGVVPAALLLLPYHLLTGQDLGTNIACLVFWLIGFGASLYWLRSWWRDFGPIGGSSLAALLVGLLAFFPATTFLVRRSMFYELPLVSGFACISVFFAAFFEIVRRRGSLPTLAVASGSLGLAVGCHPNHIFLLPLLVLPAFTVARDASNGGTRWGASASAALLPAAAIGICLAWYNYARFGDIFEFGFRYGQNGFFSQNQNVFAPRFLWTNFKWYFLTPPALTPYFPFVYPGNNSFRPEGYSGAEAMHGQLPATLFFVWICAGALVLARRRVDSRIPWQFLAALCYSAVAAFFFVASLQIRANRYMADFDTPLAWLCVAVGCWIWVNIRAGILATLWKTGFSILAIAGSIFYLLAAIQQFDQFHNTRPGAHSKLSQALNIPYDWLYGAGMEPSGLLAMNVRFIPRTDEAIEPIVTTGTPVYSDSVYVAQEPNHLIQFRFNHKGYGGPISPYLSVDLSREHEIEISMGSFYPPIDDIHFKRNGEHTVRLLKELAYIRMDGEVIMSTSMPCYEASPWSRQIGRNDTTLTEFKRSFSGHISQVHTVLLASFLHILDRAATSGLFRFKVEFPARAPLSGFPLLGIGQTGDGNLVFAKATGGSTYEIDLDDWSFGALIGKPFNATAGEHDVDFVLGPVLLNSAISPTWQVPGGFSVLANRVVVRIDGAVLGNFKLSHHLNQVRLLTPWCNPQGFSTAESKFGGSFSAFPMNDTEIRSLLEQAVQTSKP
jgi:hypothetical protein